MSTGLGWSSQLGLLPYPSSAIFGRNSYLSTIKELTRKGIVFRVIKDVQLSKKITCSFCFEKRARLSSSEIIFHSSFRSLWGKADVWI